MSNQFYNYFVCQRCHKQIPTLTPPTTCPHCGVKISAIVKDEVDTSLKASLVRIGLGLWSFGGLFGALILGVVLPSPWGGISAALVICLVLVGVFLLLNRPTKKRIIPVEKYGKGSRWI